ncbi:hypothetical protein SRB5_46000 [Streptomyces sp. RB5]|uniref:Uncharacterized protein n=1 Tax=Streptomyces smaragdinus TaxID=2585196 RepID=A0A7K0CMD6_9ACTN|nr:hypothetical protein [Streptomyces smaragdinus]MQY14433.1 hypothetical protein [Streptomyces smaragdinus]
MSTDTSSAPGLRAMGIGCAVLVALPVLVVLGFLVVLEVESSTPEDYPTVAPEETARQMFAVSQDAYAVLGFAPEVPPGNFTTGSDVSENGFDDLDYCYPDGLESINDQPEPNAYSFGHSWAISGVDAGEARAGMRRLRAHLEKQGWSVEDPGTGSGELGLSATKGHGDSTTTASFWWQPRQGGRFDGGVGSGCAYAPDDIDAESVDTIAFDVPPLRPTPR